MLMSQHNVTVISCSSSKHSFYTLDLAWVLRIHCIYYSIASEKENISVLEDKLNKYYEILTQMLDLLYNMTLDMQNECWVAIFNAIPLSLSLDCM